VKEIQLTQGKAAIVDDDDFDWLNQWKWSAGTQGRRGSAVRFRALRGQMINDRYQHVLMHRQIMDCPAHLSVDHVNKNPLDNRKCNLRICDQAKQALNRVGNTTGKKTSLFKGVYWQKDIGFWRARFRLKYLGTFTNEVDAAKAYDRAAREFDPDFAHLNFPVRGGLSVA